MSIQVNRSSEKWIEKALTGFVARHGGAAIKMLSTLTGLPDRLILWPGAAAEFVELKSTGKKPSAIQRTIHSEIKRLGFKCTVIDTEDKLIEWQNSYLEYIRRL